jgi:molybdopterin converting factor small subunit
MSIHLNTENNTTVVEVRLFGAFRQYLSNISDLQKSKSEIKTKFPNSIALTVQHNISIQDLRHELITQLNILRPDLDNHSLVFDSAFADEDSILEDHQFVDARSVLSILPPVCGG